MNDNPALQTYENMRTVWEMTNKPWVLNYLKDTKLSDAFFSNKYARYHQMAVGFGRRFFGLGVPGYDLTGNPVFVYGRVGPYSMDHSLTMLSDGRFRLGYLTSHIRGAIEEVSFLRQSYGGRRLVWYATTQDTPTGLYMDDFRTRVPYVDEHLLVGAPYSRSFAGWWEVVPNEDKSSRIPWKIMPARNQEMPGRSPSPIVHHHNGSQFSQARMLPAVQTLEGLREGRFRVSERNWRKKNGVEPRRYKTPKMHDGKELLVGDAAATALVATFDVSMPAKTEPWIKKAEEATT